MSCPTYDDWNLYLMWCKILIINKQSGEQVKTMAHGAADIATGAARGAVYMTQGAAAAAANLAQGAANAVNNTFATNNPPPPPHNSSS